MGQRVASDVIASAPSDPRPEKLVGGELFVRLGAILGLSSDRS